MGETPPLILVTNDDGIASPGLHAAVRSILPLGDVLVVAPKFQQSGAGRSFPMKEGTVEEVSWPATGPHKIAAYMVEGSPAQAARAGILLLAPRKPDLAISGINYGENVGTGITISGTVGAALESASFDIPTLAVSLQTRLDQHLSHSEDVDFSAAGYFVHQFAETVLHQLLPLAVDILKVEIPCGATPRTPWRVTRVSRRQYFHSIVVENNGHRTIAGYEPRFDVEQLEPDSDIYALVVDKVVSVSPLSVDLTASVDQQFLYTLLKTG